jgi:hypothetical protein
MFCNKSDLERNRAPKPAHSGEIQPRRLNTNRRLRELRHYGRAAAVYPWLWRASASLTRSATGAVSILAGAMHNAEGAYGLLVHLASSLQPLLSLVRHQSLSGTRPQLSVKISDIEPLLFQDNLSLPNLVPAQIHRGSNCSGRVLLTSWRLGLLRLVLALSLLRLVLPLRLLRLRRLPLLQRL